MVGYGLRRVLHALIRLVVVHKIGTALLAVLTLAVLTLGLGRVNIFGGLSSVQAFNTASASVNTASASVPAGATVAPATATEQYLRGSQQFDAQLIWESLSEDVRSSAQARGEGIDSLQQRLDQTRATGGRVETVRYIGGFVPNTGDSMYFYVVTMANPSASAEPQNVFYVFTVDQNGKIKSIE